MCGLTAGALPLATCKLAWGGRGGAGEWVDEAEAGAFAAAVRFTCAAVAVREDVVQRQVVILQPLKRKPNQKLIKRQLNRDLADR